LFGISDIEVWLLFVIWNLLFDDLFYGFPIYFGLGKLMRKSIKVGLTGKK